MKLLFEDLFKSKDKKPRQSFWGEYWDVIRVMLINRTALCVAASALIFLGSELYSDPLTKAVIVADVSVRIACSFAIAILSSLLIQLSYIIPSLVKDLLEYKRQS